MVFVGKVFIILWILNSWWVSHMFVILALRREICDKYHTFLNANLILGYNLLSDIIYLYSINVKPQVFVLKKYHFYWYHSALSAFEYCHVVPCYIQVNVALWKNQFWIFLSSYIVEDSSNNCQWKCTSLQNLFERVLWIACFIWNFKD